MFYLNIIYNKYNLLICLLFMFHIGYSQDNTSPKEYKVFYHENGNISSEGFFENNLPTGVWKNYHENGKLKSIGKRTNNKADSTWLFYNDFEIRINEVSFKNGLKNGWDMKYGNDGFLVSKEYFKEGKKEGFCYYYIDNLLSRKSFYMNDILTSYSYEYDKQGNIITLFNYNNGFIKTRDYINRTNKEGKKEGKWIEFFPCFEPCNKPYIIKNEGRYINGLKNGYFKEYDKNGEVLSVLLYKDDELVIEKDLEKIELVTEYYPNAKVKSVKGFKKGVLEGNSFEYDSVGNLINVQVYKDGFLLLQGGTIDSLGLKQGEWKEFHKNGSLRSKGEYLNGSKHGNWLYFFENGKEEQKGKYAKGGKYHGEWIWFYENGNIKRKETYKNGVENGVVIEYNDTNEIMLQGEFIDGEREGAWMLIQGDYKEEGQYIGNERDGEWKHYYVSNGELSYKGNYSDGIPTGKHTWYHPTGKKMLEGSYEAGQREGEWKRYDVNGLEILKIYYESGNEVRLNGIKIKPKSVDDFNIEDYKIMK